MSDKIFTDEVKKQLEGIIPCAVNSTRAITPDCFDGIPAEYQPVFKIKGLTKADVIEMENLTKHYVENKVSDYDGYYNFIWNHITNWSNLYDLNTGKELKYDRQNFEAFPAVLVLSLFREYQIMNGVIDRAKEALTL